MNVSANKGVAKLDCFKHYIYAKVTMKQSNVKMQSEMHQSKDKNVLKNYYTQWKMEFVCVQLVNKTCNVVSTQNSNYS